MKTNSIIGSITAKAAAFLVAFGCTLGAWADDVAKIGDTTYTSFEDLAAAIGSATYANGVLTFTDNVTLSNYIRILADVTIDLNGKTVTGNSANDRCISIGSSASPANVTIQDTGTGGKVTIEHPTDHKFALYVWTGSSLTITGGEYSGAQNCDIANYGGNVTITGGTFKNGEFYTFGNSDSRASITGGLFGSAPSTSYIPEGSKVVWNSTYEKYEITDGAPVEIYNGAVLAGSYSTLAAAIQAVTSGQKIALAAGGFDLPNNAVIPANVTIEGQGKDSSNDYKTRVYITNERGGDFDGLKITNENVAFKGMKVWSGIANNDGFSMINVRAAGAVIENCLLDGGGMGGSCATLRLDSIASPSTFTVKDSTVTGAYRGIYRTSGSADVIVQNSTITNVYAINFGSEGGSLSVTGGNVNGWTSYAAGLTSATFTGVTFGEGYSNQNTVQPYMDTCFTDCTFNGTTVTGPNDHTDYNWTFTNCKFGDVALTESNATGLLGPIWEGTVTIDGVRAEGGQVRIYDSTGAYVKGYATSRLATAVQTNTSANCTVKLFADINRTALLQIKQSLTFDLNGRNLAINGTGANDYFGLIISGAYTVTFTDSSSGGTYGTISNTSEISGKNTRAIQLQNGATVYIENIAVTGTAYGIYNSASTLYVQSGALSGATAPVAANSSALLTSITGGIFSTEPSASYVAANYLVVPNTDAATSSAYPYAVAMAAAKIGDVAYATFAEAITAAEAYYAENGSYPTITVIDATASLDASSDWKISNGYLVKKVYVAQVISSDGATTNKYETVAEAATGLSAGCTLRLLANASISSAIAVANNLTVDLNGFTLTSSALAFNISAGTLTLTGDGTLVGGNGAISSSGTNSGTGLTLGGVAITATGSDAVAWGAYHGTITVVDGTTNTITASTSGMDGIYCYSGYYDYLTITGNGQLTVYGANDGIHIYYMTPYITADVRANGGKYGFEMYGDGANGTKGIANGLYSNDVSSNCADGFVCIANDDAGTSATYPYAVVDVTAFNVVLSKNGAMTPYDTIADALTAAGEGSATIYLYSDLTENVSVAANQNITFVGGTSKVTGTISVAEGGALAVRSGKFTVDPESVLDYGYVVDLDDGVYTVVVRQLVADGEGDFHIYTLDDLAAFRNMVNAGDDFYAETVILEANIDMSPISNWEPIGTDITSFSGAFDGNGKKLSGMTVVGSVDVIGGLFRILGEGAEVSNLRICDAAVSGSYAAALAYDAEQSTVIDGVYVDADTTVTATSYAAGLVARNVYGDVYNCWNYATVSSRGIAAGIAAYIQGTSADNFATISNCVNKGTVSGSNRAGGVVAHANYANVMWCYNAGAVSKTSSSAAMPAGGIVAVPASSSVVSYCLNTGSVSTVGSDVNCSAGGIVGHDPGATVTVKYCDNLGNVTASDYNASGIAGSIYGLNISYCRNSGDITAAGIAAGASAKPAYGNVTAVKCVNDGTISGATTYQLGQNNNGGYYYDGNTLKTAAGADATTEDALAVLNGGDDSAFWLLDDNGRIITILTMPEDPVFAVAQIGDVKYETFADAIAAADAALSETGVDPVITVIDATAELSPAADWKLSNDGTALVRKTVIANVLFGGVIVGKYESLSDAVDAVPTDGTAHTVALLANASGKGVKTRSGQNVTIDFGGYSYDVTTTVGSAGTETSGMQLNAGSTVVLTNGTLTAKVSINSYVIQNYANLTVVDMTVGSKNIYNQRVLSMNNGTVLVCGDSHILAGNAQVSIAVCYWPSEYPDGAHVTVDTTGTVNGKINIVGSGAIDSDLAILNMDFTTQSKNKIEVQSGVSNAAEKINVSGGLWYAAVTAAHLAEGCGNLNVGSNKYRVCAETDPVVVVKAGTTFYTNLASTVSSPTSATTKYTYTLLKNVSLAEGEDLVVRGLITLNCGEYEVSFNGGQVEIQPERSLTLDKQLTGVSVVPATEGYEIVESGTVWAYTYTCAPTAAIAVASATDPQGNTTYYMSVSAAFAAAANDSTVTLLRTDTARVNYTGENSYTLDLNDNALSYSSTYSALIWGSTNTLTIVDGGLGKTGLIENTKSSSYHALQCSKGKVIVKGGKLSALGYGLYVSTVAGSAEIVGGEVESLTSGKTAVYSAGSVVVSNAVDNGTTTVPKFKSVGEGVAILKAYNAGSIAVSGGVYSVEPNSDYVADGCIIVANADASTSATYPYAVAKAVAQIGDVKYATFADAIAAAEAYYAENGSYPTITVLDDTAEQGNADWKIADGYLVRKVYVAQIVRNEGATIYKYESLSAAVTGAVTGDTIQMLADETLASSISVRKKITIDLNGRTVSYEGSTDSSYVFYLSSSSYALSIEDSATNGAIDVTGKGMAVYAKNAVVTVSGGTVSAPLYGIYSKGATVSVSGGTVIGQYGIYANTGSVTVSGGEVSGVNGTDKTDGIYLYGASLHVTGGTISADDGIVMNPLINTSAKAFAIYSGGTSTITIDDGNIVSSCVGLAILGGTVTVNGGTIDAYCSAISGYASYPANITITGGTLIGGKDDADATIYHPHAGTLTITDGTISGATPVYAKSGTIAISGGTFTAMGTAQDYNNRPNNNVNWITGDAVIIDNCASAGGYPGFTSVSISGGMFVSANAQPVASYAAGDGNVQIKNFVSGGYYSTAVPVTYCATGCLCTTKPMANGLYAVVPKATVTFTLDGTAPEGAEAPASFDYPSGDLADIALDAPSYDSASTSIFAGWKIGGEGDAISILPAGTTGNVTLVATWTAAKTVEVQGDTATVEVKLPEDWLEAKAEGSDKTNEAALNDVAANGNKVWENYVLGLDGSNPNAGVSADAAQGSTTVMPVSSTIAAPAVDTGFTVTYQVDELNADGQVVASGDAQATPDLAIDLSTVESNAYFKVTATIKSGGDTVSTVTSTNTIGVLVVSNGANTVAIAVPWASYDGTGAISVSNLVRTANLTPGDTLQAYDSESKKYKSWKLSADKTWEPQTVAGGSSETAADAYTVARGSAVWLTRADPTQPIYLVGGAAEAEKAEVGLAGGTPESPGWNLVGASGTEPVDVGTVVGAAMTTDKVVVPTAYVPKNYEYVDGTGWGYWDNETYTDAKGRKRVRKVFRTDTLIPAGTGFWYLNGGEAKTIEL